MAFNSPCSPQTSAYDLDWMSGESQWGTPNTSSDLEIHLRHDRLWKPKRRHRVVALQFSRCGLSQKLHSPPQAFSIRKMGTHYFLLELKAGLMKASISRQPSLPHPASLSPGNYCSNFPTGLHLLWEVTGTDTRALFKCRRYQNSSVFPPHSE